MLQAWKLEGWSQLGPLVLGMELQTWELAQLGSALYSISSLHLFLPFAMVMCNVHHCMLEVDDRSFS